MKKLFFIAAMALTSLSASAQHQVGGVTLQPNLSMTLATVTGDDDNKMKVGIAAGAELEYQATEMLGLAGGVQYAMQGGKADHDIKLNLDYLNIPLRAKVYVAPGFSINAGVQFGVPVPESAAVNDSYFDDACFIGHSLVVGMSDYFRLPNADFYAVNGISA